MQRRLFDPSLEPLNTAVLSACRAYRYSLLRVWDHDALPTLWLMLNPSTADAQRDDPTVRRCIGFARSWGAGGIIVCNLFAYRTPSPVALMKAHQAQKDVVGPERDNYIRGALQCVDNVVCAWGSHPLAQTQAPAVLALIPEHMEVSCLGTTSDGSPRHPLYLSSLTQRERYPARAR